MGNSGYAYPRGVGRDRGLHTRESLEQFLYVVCGVCIPEEGRGRQGSAYPRELKAFRIWGMRGMHTRGIANPTHSWEPQNANHIVLWDLLNLDLNV